MSLGRDEPRMIWNLYHLYDSSVRRNTGENHAVFGQCFPEIVVYFIAVAVTLGNLFLTVQLLCFRSVCQDAWICAET